MVTSTAPFMARFSPSVAGEDPEPLVYPPGWSHTITGRLSDAAFAAVQTLRKRQSSLLAGPRAASPPRAPSGAGPFTAAAPSFGAPSFGAPPFGAPPRPLPPPPPPPCMHELPN